MASETEAVHTSVRRCTVTFESESEHCVFQDEVQWRCDAGSADIGSYGRTIQFFVASSETKDLSEADIFNAQVAWRIQTATEKSRTGEYAPMQALVNWNDPSIAGLLRKRMNRDLSLGGNSLSEANHHDQVSLAWTPIAFLSTLHS